LLRIMIFLRFLALAMAGIIVHCCPPKPNFSINCPQKSSPCQGYSSYCQLAWDHRPYLKFDRKAKDKCFPDEAKNENDGHCRHHNCDAPIYWTIEQCGGYLKLAWWFWYGWQGTCSPGLGSHGNDWEHIVINFKPNSRKKRFSESGPRWKVDSVTYYQHNGQYTRKTTSKNPNVYVGKNAHGSYDNWCDGKGAVWQSDYCAGGCGYWEDFRNDQGTTWMPTNIKHINEIEPGHVKDAIMRQNYYWDSAEKHSCKGPDARLVTTSGCWRNNHVFPAPICKKQCSMDNGIEYCGIAPV